MFIQIKSENPKLSWILNKNPNTIPLIKKQRDGVSIAWFSNETTYNLRYDENTIKVNPYCNDDDNKTNYTSNQKFTSCTCALALISNFLNSLYNKDSDDDKEGFKNQMIIATPNIRGKIIESFQRHFTDYEITYEKYLIIKSEKKVRELLAIASVMLIIESIKQEELFITSNDIITKYLNCINLIQSPYFIRYLFKFNILTSKKKFEENKDLINTDRIEMEIGTNFQQRFKFIENKLSFQNSILDFGCGEGKYLKFSKKIKDKIYYCFDKDDKIKELIENKIKRKKYDNVQFEEEIKIKEPVEVILSEVIEHNEKEDIEKIFLSLKHLNIQSMIITTPNKDFNDFYGLDDQLRHNDHKIEFNKEEFEKLVIDNLSKIGITEEKYSFEVGNLGDTVENIQPQLYYLITKN